MLATSSNIHICTSKALKDLLDAIADRTGFTSGVVPEQSSKMQASHMNDKEKMTRIQLHASFADTSFADKAALQQSSYTRTYTISAVMLRNEYFSSWGLMATVSLCVLVF